MGQGWQETEHGSGGQEWRAVIHSHGVGGDLQTCNTLSTYPRDPEVETSSKGFSVCVCVTTSLRAVPTQFFSNFYFYVKAKEAN